jgi:hypothetical protein
MAKTQSTVAKVTDLGAVEAVLDAYAYRFDVELLAAGMLTGGTIRIADAGRWPHAVRRELLPDPEDTAPADYDALEADVFAEHGGDGFVGLLRDLAPLLKSPLTVVALLRAGERCWAQAWTVLPGAAEVQVAELEEGPAGG